MLKILNKIIKNIYFYFINKTLISILLILILILTLLKKNYISICCLIAFNIILLLLFLTYLSQKFILKFYWFVESFLVTDYIEQALHTFCIMFNSIILELFKRSSRPNLQFIPFFFLFTINFSLCDGYDLPNNNGETIFLIIFFSAVGYCLAYVYSNSVKRSLDEYEEFNNNNNVMYGPVPKPEHTLLNSIKEYDLFIFLDNWGYLLFIIIFMVLVLLSYIISKVYIKRNIKFYNFIGFSLRFTVIFFFIKLIYMYLNIVSILFGIVLIISLYYLTNIYFKKYK